MIELYKNKTDCCACGACVSVCPKSAISFKNDEYGFAYPEIDRALCIECGMCKRVCAFQNKDKENRPAQAYAAAVNDSEKIMHSTSGGAFAVLAEETLRRGGVVFGAALEKENDLFTVHHIAIKDIDDLQKILKSKYVQSATEDCYIKAKEYLDNGRLVLYSGTPCQIAGLKGYLGRPYDNLITVDLVCHGVPSLDLFRNYIAEIEKKENIKITDFHFRDKEKGWATQYRKIDFITADGEYKSKSFDKSDLLYSYFELYKNYSLRDNCYTCKYAGENRPADISLGDCWGIKRMHSDWLEENSEKINMDRGISCVVINTDKGINYFESVLKYFIFIKSDFKSISSNNTQLQKPSAKPTDRDKVMDIYKNTGYAGIEKRYQQILNKAKTKKAIKKLIPDKIIKMIKG